jgi:hypothetical protein
MAGCKLHLAMASISTNLWHLTVSRRVKKLVSIRGRLTFFFFLRFLPTECPQNSLKPGGASKARKGWFFETQPSLFQNTDSAISCGLPKT